MSFLFHCLLLVLIQIVTSNEARTLVSQFPNAEGSVSPPHPLTSSIPISENNKEIVFPSPTPSNLPTPLTCDNGFYTIEVRILTDTWPSETSWTLSEVCNGVNIIAQGGSYNLNSTVYTETICVASNTQHMFTIFDSFGDGLCSGSGCGHYQLKMDGVVIASGAEFVSNESALFGSCAKLACADNMGRFDVTKPNGALIANRDCAWVGMHSFRCDFAGAAENCPVTCDTCFVVPPVEAMRRFDVTKPNGALIANRDCAWVGMHSFRCDFDGARNNCPVTCDACLS